jgi:5-methylcytosine-specific restriction protein A
MDQRRSLRADRAHAHLYNSSRWQQLRRRILQARPLCECGECQGGRRHVMVASVVHHVQPHQGDEARFFDPANLQALAKPCHDRLTGQSRNTRKTRTSARAAGNNSGGRLKC